MKITSPAEGYTATDRYGADVVLEFKDGVAEYDGDLPHGVRQYLVGAGYGIGSKKPTQPEPATVPDPRDSTIEQVGTPLRDAAVDPEEGDFLPPTNAGKEGEAGNPHGPNVVAPGIHAVGTGPIVPGPVGRFEEVEDEDGSKTQVVISDTEEQQRRETTAAEEVFIEQRPVPTVTAELGEEVGQPAPEAVDGDVVPAADLKGEALDAALEEAGLVKTGSADEKRARLAEHRGEA